MNWEKFNNILEGLPFKLTDEQRLFLVGFITGEGNWTLLGDAGVGKSTIMLILNKYFQDEILFVASTGTASEEMPNDIGSGTGHSLFNLARGRAIESDWKKRPSDILTKTDLIKIIVLEEGYCYNSQDLKMIQKQILKVNKKSKKRSQRDIRLLLIGDPLQRLPIVNNEDKQYYTEQYGHWLMFYSEVWEDMQFTPFVLQQVKRQKGSEPKDVWFKKALQVLRYGMEQHYGKIIEGFNRKFVGGNHAEDALYIAPTNAKVNTYNEQYLARNPNRKMTYKVQFDKKYNKKDFPMDWEVTLAEGVKILTLVNNPEEGYFNGTVLTCTQLCADGVYATRKDGTEVFVSLHEFKEEELYAAEEDRNGISTLVQKRRHVASAFMLPCKIFAGITFARCQGKTIDEEVVIDFGGGNETWLYTKAGMEDFMVAGAFVGLSRATSIDYVKLRNPMKKEHIKVCRESIRFWYECVERMKDYA
ncbi:hypothetical protein KUA24_107 [Vibrio phage HNL01]|nr:hypothetical protein KUA24_107 [Vibrio phage HNL01]